MKTSKSGGAFANSATGYGKKPNSAFSSSQRHYSKSSAKDEVTKVVTKKGDKPKCEHHKLVDDDGNELNSGFGAYLRSSEGEYLRKKIHKSSIDRRLLRYLPLVEFTNKKPRVRLG